MGGPFGRAYMTEEEKAKFLGLNAHHVFGFSELPIPKRVPNMSE